MTDIKDYIALVSKCLALTKSISVPEAEKRASLFLEAQGKLAEWKHLLAEEKIKLSSIQTATFAEEMAKGTAKTMTENKMTAEASKEYIKAREELERIENDISYIRTYGELFSNAHLFYRQMCKELI